VTLTYHPILYWRCAKCKSHGEITHEVADASDVTWPRVLDAHAKASPLCATRGDAGIAVRSENGHLPEAS